MLMCRCTSLREVLSILTLLRQNWWQCLHGCKGWDFYTAKNPDLLKVTAQFPGHPKANGTWFVWVIRDTVDVAGCRVHLLVQPRTIIFIYIFALFTLIET